MKISAYHDASLLGGKSAENHSANNGVTEHRWRRQEARSANKSALAEIVTAEHDDLLIRIFNQQDALEGLRLSRVSGRVGPIGGRMTMCF